MSPRQALHEFFAALGRHDLEAATALFAPDAEFVAVRPGPVTATDLYGTYHGCAGVADVMRRVAALMEPQAWEATHVGEDGPLGFAQGRFHYRLRATGKPFASNWAMLCALRPADGLIAWLNLYEDSEAYAAAARP